MIALARKILTIIYAILKNEASSYDEEMYQVLQDRMLEHRQDKMIKELVSSGFVVTPLRLLIIRTFKDTDHNIVTMDIRPQQHSNTTSNYCCILTKNERLPILGSLGILGEPSGTRTPDTLIKSQGKPITSSYFW